MNDNRAAADLLDEFLDARTTGAGQALVEHDPDLAALVEAFYASDDTPGPPPHLSNQIWRDLTVVARQNGHHTTGFREQEFRIDPDTGPDLRGERPGRSMQRGRWALSMLATAALVLLALGGALLAIQGTRPAFDQPAESLYLPANTTSVAPVLVMEGTAEVWPETDTLLWATFQRITINPGDAEPADRAVGDATVLFTIETGQLTVEASGPVLVTRGTDKGSSAAATVTTIRLEVNDQLFAPAGVTMDRRNEGSQPVNVLELRISSLEQLYRPENVHYQRLMPDKVLNTPPPAPAVMSVHRLELPPGESLAIGELPGLQMLVVESGSLELIGGYQLGSQEATRSDTLAAGSGQAHFDTTTGLANRGIEPAVFLAVTIYPAP